MKLGKLMDLMNRDYDQNDPRFLKEVQLKVYKQANESKIEVVETLKNNMVMNPETIGLSKDNHYLDDMEQSLQTIDLAYSKNLEETQEKIR